MNRVERLIEKRDYLEGWYNRMKRRRPKSKEGKAALDAEFRRLFAERDKLYNFARHMRPKSEEELRAELMRREKKHSTGHRQVCFTKIVTR